MTACSTPKRYDLALWSIVRRAHNWLYEPCPFRLRKAMLHRFIFANFSKAPRWLTNRESPRVVDRLSTRVGRIDILTVWTQAQFVRERRLSRKKIAELRIAAFAQAKLHRIKRCRIRLQTEQTNGITV